jgi:hypothetical protein
MTQEQHDAVIKFCIALTFCCTVIIMVGVSLYSVVFVEQPQMMAPADKQFFLILSDMSKYILGSLATLLAVKGKDAVQQFIPPGLSTAADREDKPTPPTPKSPAPAHAPVRMEPTIDPISSPPPVATGYNGKPAPVQPPHPEIS